MHLYLKLFFILVLTGCTNSSSTDTPLLKKSSTHDFFPSKVGNEWVFDRYSTASFSNYNENWAYDGIDSFGFNIDSLDVSLSTFSFEVERKKNILIEDTLYEAHIINNGFQVPYYFGNKGIYNLGIFINSNDSLLNKGLYIPKPIPENVSWGGQLSFVIDGFLKTSQVYDRRVVSKNEIINTPAGSFECIVIRTMIEEPIDIAGYTTLFEYYSKDVGLIAKVKMNWVPDLYWQLEYLDLLKRYQVDIHKN